MIGYALLVLIATFVVIVGSIVVGVAIWGWGQQKKERVANAAAIQLASAQLLKSSQPTQ